MLPSALGAWPPEAAGPGARIWVPGEVTGPPRGCSAGCRAPPGTGPVR